MDMFPRQHPGDDLDAQFLADLPDDRSYAVPQGSFEDAIAILRDPDDMIPMVKNGVTSRDVGHRLTP
jgi:hypothetical protein